MSKNAKLERLDLRVSPEHKRLIESAARARGQTVAGFATSQLIDASARIIEQHEMRVLTDRDRDRFLKMLDNAKPNAALVRAFKRYRRMHGA